MSECYTNIQKILLQRKAQSKIQDADQEYFIICRHYFLINEYKKNDLQERKKKSNSYQY